LQIWQGIPAWLLVTPMMRHGQEPFDGEHFFHGRAKACHRLHVVVDGVDDSPEVVEIDVRHQESSARLQNAMDLLEFFRLPYAHILEHTERDDEVELLSLEGDPILYEVDFDQTWVWTVNGDIHTVVSDVRSNELAECRRPASNVKEIGCSSAA
jgi:hypothetical protein